MPEFQVQDESEIWDFVRANPLGLIATNGPDGPQATHVPMLIRQGTKTSLRGHMMRKTAYWHAIHESPRLLVAFTGPDAPVMESWNERRPFGGTWNYMAVHVRGSVRWLPESELLGLLQELKDSYEEDAASKFEHLPETYIQSLIKAIEGFEVEVESVQAVFKLSQNRPRADFERTLEELRLRGGEGALVAAEMERRRTSFYPSG